MDVKQHESKPAVASSLDLLLHGGKAEQAAERRLLGILTDGLGPGGTRILTQCAKTLAKRVLLLSKVYC